MSNISLFSSGYNECDSGLEVFLDGSNDVILNDGGINGQFLSYSAMIAMPCGFDTDLIYELIITGCNEDGSLACFSFNIAFPDCDEECDDGRGGDPRGRNEDSDGANLVNMYPNPSGQNVFISIGNRTSELNNLQLIDQLGRVIKDLDFNSNVSIDVSNIASGVHFVRLSDAYGNTISLEKLIIL